MQETQNTLVNNRKVWIDNLRWITILIVVIFHVFYYYNNIGIAPMFERLQANPLEQGGQPSLFYFFKFPVKVLIFFFQK